MPETLVWRHESPSIDWPEDVARIKSVLEARGYTASDEDIVKAWESYSDSVCAGWLVLPSDDDEIFDAVKREFDRNSHAALGM
jgi:hypothetical protein